MTATIAQNNLQKNICKECGHMLQGRVDKKFCSDYCRSAFNNRLKTEDKLLFRKVWQILRKNRSILEELHRTGKFRVPKTGLQLRGFLFNFCTCHVPTSREGICFFCFEYGYRSLDEETVMIVRREGLPGE